MAIYVSDKFDSESYPNMETMEDGNFGDTFMLIGMKLYNYA